MTRTPSRTRFVNVGKKCAVEVCDRDAKKRGWCQQHYLRWWTTGDAGTTAVRAMWQSQSELLRLGTPEDADPEACWLWTRAVGSHGYGAVGVEGMARLAHRISYEEFVGPIPPGYQVDHLCRVRRCVNPRHLEAVTQAENLRREHAAQAQGVV